MVGLRWVRWSGPGPIFVVGPEMDIGWFNPRIRMGWVGSDFYHFFGGRGWFGLGAIFECEIETRNE